MARSPSWCSCSFWVFNPKSQSSASTRSNCFHFETINPRTINVCMCINFGRQPNNQGNVGANVANVKYGVTNIDLFLLSCRLAIYLDLSLSFRQLKMISLPIFLIKLIVRTNNLCICQSGLGNLVEIILISKLILTINTHSITSTWYAMTMIAETLHVTWFCKIGPVGFRLN